jgi:Zn-dependent peptidase ImmA (M78 family)
VLVLVHWLPHFVLPPLHTSAHVPFEQTSPEAHGVAQAPQFAGSFLMSTQMLPHWVVPPAHEIAH